MVLSALGIIMVVDSHSWSVLPLFQGIIPYNSFFMPLFVFISGYFNKVDTGSDLLRHIKNRTVKLFAPYCLISFICFIFEMLLYPKLVFPIDIFDIAQSICRLFTDGSVVSIAFPLWFVPALLITDLIYSLISKYIDRKKHSLPILLFFIIIHLLSVYLARNGLIIDYSLLLSKACFFLVFMHAGSIYRDRLEDKMRRLNKPLLLVSLLLINIVRGIYLPDPYDVAFNDINFMCGFTSPYIVTPLISSLIGILFWLTMTDWIGKAFYDKRIISYTSDNTFWIMGFHILFFGFLNKALYLVNSIMPLKGFDAEQCTYNISYLWKEYDQFRFVYFIAGFCGSLLAKYLFDRIMNKVRSKSVEKNTCV